MEAAEAMAEHTFQLSVVTPERVVLETGTRSVTLPACDGKLGILAHRAPLLARLGAGRLTAETTSGEEVYFVDGCFAQMVDNRVTVPTESASWPEELDLDPATEITILSRATASSFLSAAVPRHIGSVDG